jgi:hypothetical protein
MREDSMLDEQILYEGRIPFKVAHFSHRVTWLLLWGWNIGLLLSWLETFGKMIKITSQRIVLKSGVFSQEMEEVEYYRIHDTAYQQGILERFFGIGTITLFSNDTTAPTFSFTIDNPEYYREYIRECIKSERKRMGTIQFD